MAKVDLTAQRLRELLVYEPETGAFTWRIHRRGPARAGTPAGCISNGYLRISINDYLHLGHRLAWLYTHDKWPDGDIDHINGERGDNRLSNLRDVSRATNIQNQRHAGSRSSSGLLGVSRASWPGWWQVHICANGVIYALGSFRDPEVAHQAYLEAKRRLHAGCTI